MNTAFALMAQYDGRVIIPVETVCADFFPHLSFGAFMRKISAGDIVLPVVRIEESQKSARGVHIGDLASYLDTRRAAAQRETKQLCG